MSTADRIATLLGGTWYNRLRIVGSFVAGFAFSILVLEGYLVFGLLVAGATAGSIVGLRFFADRTLVDERERELSKTVAYWTTCITGCGGTAVLVTGFVLAELGVLTVTQRMFGAAIAFAAFCFVYMGVLAVVRWRA